MRVTALADFDSTSIKVGGKVTAQHKIDSTQFNITSTKVGDLTMI